MANKIDTSYIEQLTQAMKDELTTINQYEEILKISSLPENTRKAIEEIIEDEKDHAVILAAITETEITDTFPNSGDVKTESWGIHIEDPYVDEAYEILRKYANDKAEELNQLWSEPMYSPRGAYVNPHTIKLPEVAQFVEDDGVSELIAHGYSKSSASQLVDNFLQTEFYSDKAFLEAKESSIPKENNDDSLISIVQISKDEMEGTKTYEISANVKYDEDKSLTAYSDIAESIDVYNQNIEENNDYNIELKSFGAGRLTLKVISHTDIDEDEANFIISDILRGNDNVWTDFE